MIYFQRRKKMQINPLLMLIFILIIIYFIIKNIYLLFKEPEKKMWLSVSDILDYHLGETIIIRGQKFLILKKDYKNKKIYIELL
jgi:hypothetical protein